MKKLFGLFILLSIGSYSMAAMGVKVLKGIVSPRAAVILRGDDSRKPLNWVCDGQARDLRAERAEVLAKLLRQLRLFKVACLNSPKMWDNIIDERLRAEVPKSLSSSNETTSENLDLVSTNNRLDLAARWFGDNLPNDIISNLLGAYCLRGHDISNLFSDVHIVSKDNFNEFIKDITLPRAILLLALYEIFVLRRLVAHGVVTIIADDGRPLDRNMIRLDLSSYPYLKHVYGAMPKTISTAFKHLVKGLTQ